MDKLYLIRRAEVTIATPRANEAAHEAQKKAWCPRARNARPQCGIICVPAGPSSNWITERLSRVKVTFVTTVSAFPVVDELTARSAAGGNFCSQRVERTRAPMLKVVLPR